MKVKLLKITLQNFCDIKQKTINFKSSNNLYGDNETGKTTILDAHFWLFTGKNHNYKKKDFEPKPLDENGEPVHNLVTKVTEIWQIGDQTIELGKKWVEDWKTRNGEKVKVKGHTSEYIINSIDGKQKKEFEQFVNENIAPIDLIPLLTDPMKFNSLHWEKMRERLIELENVTDEQVIDEKNKDYDIEQQIKKYGAEEYKDKLESDKKDIQKSQSKLSSSIETLKNEITEEPERSQEELEAEIEKINNKIAEVKSQDSQTNTKVKELKTKLSNLKSERLKVKANLLDKQEEENEDIREQLEKLKDDKSEVKNDTNKLENKIEQKENELDNKQQKVEDLRDKYDRIAEKEPEQAFECPHCGKEVYNYQINDSKEDFYEWRANKLEEIDDKGVSLLSEVEGLQEEITELKDKKESNQDTIETLDSQIKDLEEKKEKESSNIEENQDIKKLTYDIKKVKKKIKQEKQKDESEQKSERLEELEDKKEKLQNKRDIYVENRKNKKAVKAKEKKLKGLRGKLDNVQEKINKVEQFIKDKAFFLQEKVNKRFDVASFRLFEEKLNGVINPDCVCLVGGTPFEQNTNLGAKVNAGLDIIDKFQKEYDIRLPVFVDNAESITDIYEVDTQLIKLIKPEIDSEEKREYYSELKQRRMS